MTNRCQRLPRPTRVLVITFSVALMGASALLDEEPQVEQGPIVVDPGDPPLPDPLGMAHAERLLLRGCRAPEHRSLRCYAMHQSPLIRLPKGACRCLPLL